MAIEGGCRPVKVQSEGGWRGRRTETEETEGAAGKGRLSFSRETCAAVNSIDHWLSMRGLTGIHTRDWTLTGNILFALSDIYEETFF